MATDFTLIRGTSKRVLITGVDAEGSPYNFTNTSVIFLIATTPSTEKTITINGSGVGTSTTGIKLGRPNPANHAGPLVNTTAAEGFLTVRFSPTESAGFNVGAYPYEARVESTGIDGADVYILQTGIMTVAPSLFEG